MNRRQRNGMTLVEILVAVAILGIVVTGVMQSFVVQNNAYTVVDQTTETQQNLRAVSRLLERDVRMTGFMVPEGGPTCAVDSTNASDVLYVTDHEAVTVVVPGSNPERLIEPLQANLSAPINAGYTGAATTQSLLLGSLSVDGYPAYDNNGDGTPDSDFRVGGGAIVMDTSNPGRGTACGTVLYVNPGAAAISVDFETALGAGGGTLVLIPAHRYAIRDPLNGIDDDANGVVDDSTLTRDGTPLVSDVDDLQVAFGIDADDNGTLDPATEYFGNGAAADYNPRNTNHRNLREIRLNLVMRSRTAEAGWSEGFMQATENRAAVGANDGFRRRVVTSTVKPRNLGFRGSNQAS